MRYLILLLALMLVSCEATLCDCIHAEKKPDGSIKDEKLRVYCDEIMTERKKELEKLAPEEQKKFLDEHQKEVEKCLNQ